MAVNGARGLDRLRLALWPRPAAIDPAGRTRRMLREEALQQQDLGTVAQAYRDGQAVYLGRGDFWKWDQDGIPAWLVPRLEDLGFLP